MDFFYRLNIRTGESTKGSNGRVLVIAGSKSYPGAALLAARAALRSGADLVYLASPEPVHSRFSDATIIPIEVKGDYFSKSSLKILEDILPKVDSVLIGPGLGRQASVKTFVNSFLKENKVPLVIDADALKLLSLGAYEKLRRAVITPHHREFQLLFGEEPDVGKCKERASFGREIIIVLKGNKDYVTDGKNIYINRTGNPGMTVGGTGDILGGIIASFIAQGNTLYQSSRAATHLLGRIGDLLKKDHGYNYDPEDILSVLPKETRRYNSAEKDFLGNLLASIFNKDI